MTENTTEEVDLSDAAVQQARMYGSSATEQPRKQVAHVDPLEEKLRKIRMYPSSDAERERRERTFTDEEVAAADAENLSDPEVRQRRMYDPPATEAETAPDAVTEPEPQRKQKPEAADQGGDKPAELQAEGVDPDVLTAFRTSARDLGIEPHAQQQLLDKVIPAMRERQQAALNEMREGWAEQAQGDELLSGARGFDHNLGVAQEALQRFGSPELTTLLADTGLGDHPEMIRLLLKVGRRLGRD